MGVLKAFLSAVSDLDGEASVVQTKDTWELTEIP